MAEITSELPTLLRTAQAAARHQRRYEASPTDDAAVRGALAMVAGADDTSGYIEGVTAIIVPPPQARR